MGMNTQTVYSGAIAHLPVTVTFTPKFDGAVLLYVAGSAWTSNANGTLQFDVSFDGKPAGTASVFTNETASHKALVSNIMLINIPGDGLQHSITVSAGTSSTTADGNDFLQLFLIDIDVADNAFIWNTTGPIPAYTDFKSNFSGTANCFFAGSGYMSQSGTTGLSLVLDHNEVATSSFTFNAPESHNALPPMIVPVQLSIGPHNIGLSLSDGNLVTDANDNFCIAVWW